MVVGDRPADASHRGGCVRLRASRIGVIVALLVVGWHGARAQAETLAEALAATLHHHPLLRAEQARRRASEAGIQIARSGYFPRLTASGEIQTGDHLRNGFDSGSGDWKHTADYALTLEQPLFDGFRTSNAVDEANANEQAASAAVLDTEQRVLLDAVTAFGNVQRDRDIQALRKRNAEMLQTEVEGTTESLKRGAATQTDVAQARSRHVQAMADLINAAAEAEASAIDYERIVGHRPGKLAHADLPGPMRGLTLEAAVSTAGVRNPALIRARFLERAARAAIGRVRADRLPQVKLKASAGGWTALSGSEDNSEASIGVRVEVPLFDGGEASARVTQAEAISVSLAEEARAAADQAVADAAIAWQRLSAVRDSLQSEREGADESKRALTGIREQVRLGQRSIIESLDAQRDLVAAEIRVASRERDLLVAGYSLLAAAGMLHGDGNADDLSADVAGFEPVNGLAGASVGRGLSWSATVTPTP